MFIDGESKRPRSIRLGGEKQSSSAATSPTPFRFWPELPLVFIDGGVWTTSRWIHLNPGDGTRSSSGRNDLLPLGQHMWEHGDGLPVLGRSGVAILLTALDGEGWRGGSLKAREGASTTATRRRGTARRYSDGRRDGTATTRRRGTAWRYGDGRRDGTTATRRRGTARRLCAGKVICHRFG